MMNSLDSAVDEAIAIDFLKLSLITVVNKLWSWAAIITAAISFWRMQIRALPSEFPKSDHPSPSSFGGVGGDLFVPTKAAPSTLPPPASANRTTTKQSKEEEEGGGIRGTKMEVYLYYGKDEFERGNGDGKGLDHQDDDDDDDDVVVMMKKKKKGGGGGGGGGEYRWWWSESESESQSEKMLRTKSGDRSWYRYLDLTVLDGNVVTLWDHHHHHSHSSTAYYY